MSLTELVSAGAMLEGLESTSREDVLREMVAAMVKAGRVGRKAAGPIVAALLEREGLGSTAIGRGIAVPHAKHPGVDGVAVALGRSRKGIDFASLDGQPVYLVFLLLSSERCAGRHLEALAGVARIAGDDSVESSAVRTTFSFPCV